MGLLSAKACHLDRQRLEVVRVRRSVRQQQRQQQCGFRPGKSAQGALREAWIAMWVRRANVSRGHGEDDYFPGC